MPETTTDTQGPVERLVRRLEEIADKNSDEFRYRMDVELVSGRVRYTFLAHERADKHEFLIGAGFTPEAAAESAELRLPDACKRWGYQAA